MSKKKIKVDWIWHYIANGNVCDCCNEVENSLPQFMCNAHTHGMNKYNHKDFQVVLDTDTKTIGYLLNTMGLRVQAGERFSNGDIVSGLFEDCDVRLLEVPEGDRTVLRLVIPDGKNRFPEDPTCDYPYNQQVVFTTV